MTTLFRRTANVFCAVLLAVASVNLIGVAQVSAEPGGNNGTLKVHEKGTAEGHESNSPKVCAFNFEGFQFDEGQTGTIEVTPSKGSAVALTVVFGPANSDGYAETAYVNDGGLTLVNGKYEATLYGKSGQEDEKAKSKEFTVACPATPTVTVNVPGQCIQPGSTTGSVSGRVTNTKDDTKEKVDYTVTITHQVSGETQGVTLKNVKDNEGADYLFASLAAGAYTLTVTGDDGTSTSSTFTIVECDKPVTPVKPSRTVEVCGTENDKYTIPATTGVTYYVNGQATVAGTYNGAGVVVITAQANTGYVLDGAAAWTFEFSNAPCVITVPVITRPAHADECGKKNYTISIPSIEGVKFYVGNKEVAGTYKASGNVTVRAEVLPGYQFTPDSVTAWEYSFSKKSCKVTICHATDSRTNPYVKIRVSKKAVDGKGKNDHTSHTGPIFNIELPKGANWGDIIPEVSGVTSQNWDEYGQSIWNADCVVKGDETEEPKTPIIRAVAVCSPAGVVVTLNNDGDADGYAYVNGGKVELAPGARKEVLLDVAGQDRRADVHVYDQDEKVLIDRTEVCLGQGVEKPEIPTTPPVVPVLPTATPVVARGQMPAEMPQTGASNQLAQFIATLALAAATYVATYYLQGRRKLDADS